MIPQNMIMNIKKNNPHTCIHTCGYIQKSSNKDYSQDGKWI